MCGLLRLGGPWSVTWGPWSPWYVLRGPDSFCGALIHSAGPWFLPRRPDSSYRLRPPGPDSSCGTPTSSCRPSSVSRGPACPAGPWFDVRGPDPSCGAPIRIVRPWSVPWFLNCPTGPWFVLGPWSVLRGPDSSCGSIPRGPGSFCRALILPAGPDPSRGALKPDKNRPQLWAQAGPGVPASVWGAKDMLVPGDWPLGAWPECLPPGTATAMESNSKRACSRAHLHISAKNDIVCRL